MAPQQGHRKDMKRYDVKIFKIFLLTLFLVYLPLIMYIFWERYNAAWAHTVEKHRFNFLLICFSSWYSAHASYAQSKLAIIMWTYLLNRTFQRFENFVTCNAVHPGIANTNLYQHIHWTIQMILRPIAKYLFMVSNLGIWCFVKSRVSLSVNDRG